MEKKIPFHSCRLVSSSELCQQRFKGGKAAVAPAYIAEQQNFVFLPSVSPVCVTGRGAYAADFRSVLSLMGWSQND